MKKKLLLVILSLLLLVGVVGSQAAINEWLGVEVAGDGGNGCPTGTYLFAWDGDATEGTGYGCFGSGASTKDATNTGSSAITTAASEDTISYAVSFVDASDALSWAFVGEDGMEAAAGTIYLRMKVVTTAGNISFVCATCGSVDGLEMFVMNWNPARFRLRVSSSNDDLDRSGVPDNTWFTYGVSWRTHADNDQAVSINETWTEGDNDHGTMGTAPSSFKVRTDTGEDVIVDAIVITNGWLDPVPAWW